MLGFPHYRFRRLVINGRFRPLRVHGSHGWREITEDELLRFAFDEFEASREFERNQPFDAHIILEVYDLDTLTNSNMNVHIPKIRYLKLMDDNSVSVISSYTRFLVESL